MAKSSKLKLGTRVKVIKIVDDAIAPSLKGMYGKVTDVNKLTSHIRKYCECDYIYGIKFSNRKDPVWMYDDEIRGIK